MIGPDAIHAKSKVYFFRIQSTVLVCVGDLAKEVNIFWGWGLFLSAIGFECGTQALFRWPWGLAIEYLLKSLRSGRCLIHNALAIGANAQFLSCPLPPTSDTSDGCC